MTKEIIKELLNLQRKGIEPFMTEEGWEKFWELAQEVEEEVVESDAM